MAYKRHAATIVTKVLDNCLEFYSCWQLIYWHMREFNK